MANNAQWDLAILKRRNCGIDIKAMWCNFKLRGTTVSKGYQPVPASQCKHFSELPEQLQKVYRVVLNYIFANTFSSK